MSKTDELKAGLASVGIGWIEPQDRRNKAGRYMLDQGVKMGVPVDPADVQGMLVEFCDIYVRDLEMRLDAYKKLAEDAMNLRPAPMMVFDRPHDEKWEIERGPVTSDAEGAHMDVTYSIRYPRGTFEVRQRVRSSREGYAEAYRRVERIISK